MTNELLIEKIKQIADNDPALARWLSAAVGGAVTGYMMFHADGGNPVFEVTMFTEGLGIFWGHIIQHRHQVVILYMLLVLKLVHIYL